jgi:hypothetical protein
MFKKNIIISIYMIDIFDLIHYLIGLLIVGLLVWGIIKLHLYFSKDNIPINILMNKEV